MGEWVCSGKGTQVSTQARSSQRQGVRRSSLSPECLSPGLISALSCNCLWCFCTAGQERAGSRVSAGFLGFFQKRTCPALGTALLPAAHTAQLQQHSRAGSPAALQRMSASESSSRRWNERRIQHSSHPAGCSGDSMVASALCSQELRTSLCCSGWRDRR